MKNLHNDYLAEQANRTAYDTAEAAHDEAGMEAAREAHNAIQTAIHAKGKTYARIYAAYESAMERGNDLIDLDDTIWAEDVKPLIDGLREAGVERFTFSSGWSSAVETAWLFTQNGCTLEGLVEINSRYKDMRSRAYEKAHGYLFRLA